MKETHLYTSDDKLKWWGYGEWIEEPDEVCFNYKDMDCKILRIACPEPYAKDFHMSGGYLCGYISLPKASKYFGKHYDDINIGAHGGLTYSEFQEDDKYYIGFDCSHSFDYNPSIEHMKNTAEWMKNVRDMEKKLKEDLNLHDSPIFNRTYRNIQFCINECKSMVDQLVEVESGKINE